MNYPQYSDHKNFKQVERNEWTAALIQFTWNSWGEMMEKNKITTISCTLR